MYNHIFEWLVRGINELCTCAQPQGWIGVFDVPGFEVLPCNGFEQFCITFVDEKLQQLYGQTTADLLCRNQASSRALDNTESIQVLETIVKGLDDFCRTPYATTSTMECDFLSFVYKALGVPAAAQPCNQFSIRRCGNDKDTWYTTGDFVAKSSSAVPTDMLEVLANSAIGMLGDVHMMMADSTSAGVCPKGFALFCTFDNTA